MGRVIQIGFVVIRGWVRFCHEKEVKSMSESKYGLGRMGKASVISAISDKHRQVLTLIAAGRVSSNREAYQAIYPRASAKTAGSSVSLLLSKPLMMQALQELRMEFATTDLATFSAELDQDIENARKDSAHGSVMTGLKIKARVHGLINRPVARDTDGLTINITLDPGSSPTTIEGDVIDG